MALSRTSRRRAFRASSRVVRSSISTPALAARTLSASGNERPSRFMTKLKMSPPSPQPKHFHDSRAGVTVKDGVFSPWKGHRPLNVEPAFFSWTVSPTTSTTVSLFFTSAATPTAKQRLLDLNMAVGLSSLDKPEWPSVCASETPFVNPFVNTAQGYHQRMPAGHPARQ